MSNLFIVNKKVLFLILALIGLIIILFLLTLTSPDEPPSPSVKPSSVPIFSPLPSGIALPSPTTPPAYSPEVLKKDFQRIENKQPLSVQDSQVRAQLIASLGDKSGYLEQTPSYKIEYVKAPDQFMIEILAQDANAAKASALGWFSDQGLSPQGICNLPVVIYLNYQVAQTFSGRNNTFNPIPEGCQ